MQFSDKAIDEFIAIYEREFNEPIAREDAIQMAWRLVNMYRLFLRPLPSTKADGSPPEKRQVERQDSS